MQINTTFNVGNAAYILEDRKCYEVEILEINVEEGKNGIKIDYLVNKAIPEGLLKTSYEVIRRKEAALFLSKEEVKEKLREIEEIEEKKKENDIEFPKRGEYISASVAKSCWGTMCGLGI